MCFCVHSVSAWSLITWAQPNTTRVSHPYGSIQNKYVFIRKLTYTCLLTEWQAVNLTFNTVPNGCSHLLSVDGGVVKSWGLPDLGWHCGLCAVREPMFHWCCESAWVCAMECVHWCAMVTSLTIILQHHFGRPLNCLFYSFTEKPLYSLKQENVRTI